MRLPRHNPESRRGEKPRASRVMLAVVVLGGALLVAGGWFRVLDRVSEGEGSKSTANLPEAEASPVAEQGYPFSIHGVKPGMSRTRVEELLGPPVGSAHENRIEELILTAPQVADLVVAFHQRGDDAKVRFKPGEAERLAELGSHLNEKGVSRQSFVLAGMTADGMMREDTTVLQVRRYAPTGPELEELLQALDLMDSAKLTLVFFDPEPSAVQAALVWRVERYRYDTFSQAGVWVDYVPGQDEVDSVHGDRLSVDGRQLVQAGQTLYGSLPGFEAPEVSPRDGQPLRQLSRRGAAEAIATAHKDGRFVQFEIRNHKIQWISIFHDRYL